MSDCKEDWIYKNVIVCGDRFSRSAESEQKRLKGPHHKRPRMLGKGVWSQSYRQVTSPEDFKTVV